MNQPVADRELIFVVEESPEGGYQARAPGHSIFAEGENLEELRKMLHDPFLSLRPENKPAISRPHVIK